jgi:hypothetical protein
MSILSMQSSSFCASAMSSVRLTCDACLEAFQQTRAGRELLDVLGLEVVVPHHVDVVLGQLGALFLDVDAASLEQRVIRGVVLLDDAVAGLASMRAWAGS